MKSQESHITFSGSFNNESGSSIDLFKFETDLKENKAIFNQKNTVELLGGSRLNNLELDIYDNYFIQITGILDVIGVDIDKEIGEFPETATNQKIIIAKFNLLDIIIANVHPLVMNFVSRIFFYESDTNPEARSDTYNALLVHLSQYATTSNVLFYKYLYSIEDTLTYLANFQNIQDAIFGAMNMGLEASKDVTEIISNLIGIGTVNNPTINVIRQNNLLTNIFNLICEPVPQKKLEYLNDIKNYFGNGPIDSYSLESLPIDSVVLSDSTKKFIQDYIKLKSSDTFYIKYDIWYLVYEIVRLEYFDIESKFNDLVMFYGRTILASKLSPTVSNIQILRDYFELDSFVTETQRWISLFKLEKDKKTLIGIVSNLIPALVDSSNQLY